MADTGDVAAGDADSGLAAVEAALHDRMTQCRYAEPLTSFTLSVTPEDVYEVDVVSHGRTALQQANNHLGMAHSLQRGLHVLAEIL